MSFSAKPAASRIDRYAKVLNLDETQTIAARQLYEASEAQLARSNKKLNEAMQEAQEDMNDGDSASFEKKMQKAMADQSAATTKITGSFLADLKALAHARPGRPLAVVRAASPGASGISAA